MTPLEMLHEIRAQEHRDRRACAESIRSAWHFAAFERARKLPKLADVIGPILRPSRRTTGPDQTAAAAKAWNAAFGAMFAAQEARRNG